MNPKLKPLNHKQSPTNTNIKQLSIQQALFQDSKNIFGKPNENPLLQQQPLKKPQQTIQQKPSLVANQQQVQQREIKTPMKMQRTSTKKIQMYDQFDDFNCELEDNSIKYFEGQLQKNIKQQQTLISTKKQPQNKALIVLPKLESDIKVKGTKDLQKEIDLEMSRFYDKQEDDQMY